MDYCSTTFDVANETVVNAIESRKGEPLAQADATKICDTSLCPRDDSDRICAIRKDGDGFRVRLFLSRCDMLKSNCQTSSKFNETDGFVCQDLQATSAGEVNEDLILKESSRPDLERVIVINARSVKYRSDLNGSVEEFFAATHKTPLPLDEMPPETRRNALLKVSEQISLSIPFTLLRSLEPNPKLFTSVYLRLMSISLHLAMQPSLPHLILSFISFRASNGVLILGFGRDFQILPKEKIALRV